MSYLLDTNIFIRSKNEMPIDIFQSFWHCLAKLAQEGKIFSSIKVKEEIDKGNDELTQWCDNNLPKGFFMPFEAYQEFASLMSWSNAGLFSAPAKQEFARVADAYLVATAAANGMKVVTFETSDPNCIRRVKIPDACIALSVNYCSLNDMLHELNVVI
jgi:predicted nucleic acid-binding protein